VWSEKLRLATNAKVHHGRSFHFRNAEALKGLFGCAE
jgi:hypothetical protein